MKFTIAPDGVVLDERVFPARREAEQGQDYIVGEDIHFENCILDAVGEVEFDELESGEGISIITHPFYFSMQEGE